MEGLLKIQGSIESADIPSKGYGPNLEAALKILNDNNHPVDDLPNSETDPAWNDVKAEYGLSLPQWIALKNYKRFLPWTAEVDTPKIDEDFSGSPARDLQGCLIGIPDDLTVEDALLGVGLADQCCLLELLTSKPGTIGSYIDWPSQDTEKHLRFMITTHSNWIHEHNDKLPDIPFRYKLVLRLYTVHRPIPLYKFINFVLNSEEREEAGLQYIKRFIKLIILAATALERVDGFGVSNGVAFRGLRVKDNDALKRKCDAWKTHFAEGNLKTLAGFTSVSTDPNEASKFADRLLFHLINVRGVRLKVLSCFPKEQEILILPPAIFIIQETLVHDGVLTVKLIHGDQESASYQRRYPVISRPLFEEFKEEGYKEKLYQLYLMVHSGDSLAWNKLLEAATEGNIAFAQALVCVCYSSTRVSIVPKVGMIAAKYGEQSLPWLIEESERHCHFAVTFLAILTFHGIDTNLTPAQAAEQLKHVVDNVNFAEACYYFSIALTHGRNTSQTHGRNVTQEKSPRLIPRVSSKAAYVPKRQHRYTLGRGDRMDVAEGVRLCRLAADQNFAPAQANMGICFEKGIGVDKDMAQAAHWYRLAAAQNYASAQNSLGVMYAAGNGVDENVEEAARLFLMAAEQNYSKAQSNLGLCYERGIGVEQNVREAFHWYSLAAEQAFAPAQVNLGSCYERGIGVEKDVVEAVRLYQLAADQNDLQARVNLGVCYERGIGVERSASIAVDQYGSAAEQDYAPAQIRLGVCFMRGIGVSKDIKEAKRWFDRAGITENDPMAQTNLGECYETGTGVAQNVAEALRLYRLAVDQNDSGAMVRLASCYERGVGVEENVLEAVRLYRLAVDQNDANGQVGLGSCYERGIGVEKDVAEAVRLYQLAVDQNDVTAIVHLGSCYERGIGVEKDVIEAVRLYQLAAEQNDLHARVKLGICYERGIGVQRSASEAVHQYFVAARRDYAPAQIQLGICCMRGIGVSKNIKEAKMWFDRAGNTGKDLMAQTNLGECYETGIGVTKDVAEALRLYRLAVDQNDSGAMVRLGSCYERGVGVDENVLEAVRLYRLAADQNDVTAIVHLGSCYERGIGVEKDVSEALRWYQLGAEQQFGPAEESLRRLRAANL